MPVTLACATRAYHTRVNGRDFVAEFVFLVPSFSLVDHASPTERVCPQKDRSSAEARQYTPYSV